MAALLLNLDANDEVIVPSFTFVSTANAFALRGARIVFCDIRPDTLNLDESRLEDLITPHTRAVAVVHYAGVGCEMDRICAIAARHGLAVIEDNAHGLLGKFRGRHLGSFGMCSALSFHETKNFSCGEGGALIINDAQFIARAEVIREKGTDRSRFFRGEVDKYSWVDLGSSYVLADPLAAILLGQFESSELIQARRRAIWLRYFAGLTAWAAKQDVRLPEVPKECEHPWHLFYIVLPTHEARSALIHHLRTLGIMAVFHYLPLHLSKMGRSFGRRYGQCPITESISDRLLRLPFYFDLTPAEQSAVIEAVCDFSV